MSNKIDFEDRIYNKLYAYLLEKYSNRCIYANVDKYCIEVNDGSIFYSIGLSGNETSMYFFTVPYDIRIKSTYKELNSISAFRVFSFDGAKQYVDFKLKESELIKSIEG